MSISQTHFSDPSMALANHIDELTLLTLGGRVSTALALAQAETDPLTHALGTAAVYASIGELDPLVEAVEAAVNLDHKHSLVLQAQAIALAIQGDTASAVQKATDAATSATSSIEATQRAQLGLARMMLLDGIKNPNSRQEGLELLKSMANYGKDADANLILADELGMETKFTYLAAAFMHNPRDPRSMQQLTELFKEQSWPVGLGIVCRHIRE
ncbi:MAG: hypothetical protein AAFX99_33570, partial [Myxococcota bacterium]